MKMVRLQMKQYFNGSRLLFKINTKLEMSTFLKNSLEQVKKIPFGSTMSYKNIAKNLKSPKGYRAVANANAQNPLPIVIPCHRVIKSNGELGGYAGGSSLKKKLLEFEKNIIDNN